MDVYITKLRKHLRMDEEVEIINIHGKGYKLIAKKRKKTKIKRSPPADQTHKRAHFFSEVYPLFLCRPERGARTVGCRNESPHVASPNRINGRVQPRRRETVHRHGFRFLDAAQH